MNIFRGAAKFLAERPTASRTAGLISGAAGAGVALGYGEFVDGLRESIPSLVIAVGEVVTDYTPGDVVAASIANLGSSQKTILTVGIVVACLAIGALLGALAARGRSNLAVGGFVLFGIIGGWAAARNPVSPAGLSWIVALVAAFLGIAVTLLLVERAAAVVATPEVSAEATEAVDSDDGVVLATPRRVGTRRSFFGFASGAGVAALGLVGLGRAVGGRSAAEEARETYALPSRSTDDASAASSGSGSGGSGSGSSAAASDSVSTGSVEAPESIEIPEGLAIEEIDVPAGLEIEGIDTPEIAIAEVEVAGSDNTDAEPAEISDQQASETETTESATTTEESAEQSTATPEEPEAPATTTTAEPAPTTTEAPEPAPTTTEAPVEEATVDATPTEDTTPPEPEPTVTEPPPPPTTEPPKNLSVSERLSRLDTLDDEVDGVSPYIVGNNNFYRIDTALSIPQVDPANWSLRITGLVDNPYEITYDEILAMDLRDYVVTLSCVSNQVGGGLIGNAMWTGVPIAELLQRAGVQSGAQQTVGRSVDDFTAGFPTSALYDGRNAILAVGMNNELLPTRHGFPARLVVAGLYGYISAVKWLEEIHLTTWDAFDGYWIPRGWSKYAPIKTQSRIDVPNSRTRLTAGTKTAIAGVAWAPTKGIKHIEVRVDDEAWVKARLGQVMSDETWVQWHAEWTPTPGRHRIQVRATDITGTTQGSAQVPPRPNGAEGWHTINVTV